MWFFWEKEDYYGNIGDGFTDLAPFGKLVDQASQDAINAKKEEIKSGKFDIFAGPIMDQSGAEKVAAGETISFGDQMSIDWFVKGVEGNAAG